MVFSSTVFLVLFLPIVVGLYYNPLTERLCKLWGGTPRNVILLIASLIFYAWGEPVYVFLMIASIAVIYAAGFGVASENKTRAKAFLILGVVYLVGVLFIFKYSTFIFSQLSLLFHSNGLPVVDIALPIGISFFTFQMMSYLFDVYYGKTKVQKSIFSLGLYTALFPQLIAGPIVRYNEIAEEIKERHESYALFSDGTERFILGLGKKVLIADFLARAVDIIWELDGRSIFVAWFGAVAYTLQIYFDFSGYSDMAIGLGKMFGFHFSENFNYPYVSKSVTEFWRRWHISLSSWFRDYVYIPLGGNRVSKSKWIRNMFIVWLLTGIWHGANWTFLCWGLIYFVILLLERLTCFPEKLGWFSHIYTMLIVTLAWVLFRSGSISEGLAFIAEMFGVGSIGVEVVPAVLINLRGTLFAMILAIILSSPITVRIGDRVGKAHPAAYSVLRSVLLAAIFVFSFIKIAASGYTTFIYFNF